MDTCNDSKPAKLNFNATVIHREIPTPPKFEAMIAEAVWKHDPHGAILGLLHKIADDAMGQLILEASDVVRMKKKIFLKFSFVFSLLKFLNIITT